MIGLDLIEMKTFKNDKRCFSKIDPNQV